MMRRFSIRIAAVLVVLFVGFVYSYFSGSSETASDSSSGQMDRFHTVKRGKFNITVLLDGTLDAIKRYDLRCEVRWNDKKISKLVEDRSAVKKDQILLELDPEPRQQDRERHEMELDEARKELAVAQEGLKMTRASNLSDIKNAAESLRTAQEALQKYNELEYDQKRKELSTAINGARVRLVSAQNDLSDAKEARNTSQSMDQTELATLDRNVAKAEEVVDTAQETLTKAEHNQQVFRQYDYPQKQRSLQEAVLQSQLRLQQTVVQARGKVVQGERRITHLYKQEQRAQRDLGNALKDLANMTIRSPVNGIVAFGNPYKRHWQQAKEYKVGATLNYREVVASIPDLSKFLVKIDVPEEYRSRIAIDMPAKLRSPAVPDLKMDGTLTEIAAMAQHVIGWDKGSPKIYPSKISSNVADKRLMPGMSVQVEIIVETVSDALFVPVEAVYNREGKTYVKMKSTLRSEEREVKVGRSSIHYVEILKGLNDGDKVQLFRRAGSKQ